MPHTCRTRTPEDILQTAEQLCITLNGFPARPSGLREGTFIVVVTQQPTSGHSYLSEHWHSLSAERILLAGGRFNT